MTEPAISRNGIPVPDPSVLTTDNVNMAKEDLRREAETLIRNRDALMTAMRTEFMGEIKRIEDIQNERLLRIDQRFEERDERTDQIAQLGRISLDAALAAAKEAVGEQNKSNALSITKSESSMKEQVNANATQAGTRIDALSDKVEDLKGRIDRGEGGQTGQRYERAEQQFRTTDRHASANQYTNVITAVIIAVAAIAATLIGVFH